MNRDSILRTQFWMIVGFACIGLPLMGLSYLMSNTVLYIPNGAWSVIDGGVCGIAGIVGGGLFGVWWDFGR